MQELTTTEREEAVWLAVKIVAFLCVVSIIGLVRSWWAGLGFAIGFLGTQGIKYACIWYFAWKKRRGAL